MKSLKFSIILEVVKKLKIDFFFDVFKISKIEIKTKN